ncbi:MAG: heavy-metal-associated domain-containing protein [Bacteroidia bacterium]|nr:heavy-metal-associated domain-containing protein [Bacteroidia bacterium]
MCKERIEEALVYKKGVKRAELNLETKAVTVVYNSNQISPEEIRQTIAGVGYDADDVPANGQVYEKLPACCQKGGHDN